MKKIKNYLSVGILCLGFSMAVSCSNDNEPVSGDGGTVTEVDGTRISKVGRYNVEYDEDGRPYSINSGYSGLIIDYKKGVATLTDSGDEIETIDVKFKDGYISSFSESWNYKDEDYQDKGSGKAEFKYSNGYLTQIKIESKGEEKDFEDGTTEKYEESYETKMTWKNGNMVAAFQAGVEKEGKYSDKWTYDYTYSYGSDANKYNQFLICLNDIWAEETEWEVLVALGLFGKGTSLLPIGMNYTHSYDDEDSAYSYDSRISISLNKNGSISRESFDGNSLTYSYESFTRALVEESDFQFKPMFKVFRKRKK